MRGLFPGGRCGKWQAHERRIVFERVEKFEAAVVSIHGELVSMVRV